MNTKFFNYFRNAFALIGFFIIASSLTTTDELSTESTVQSNIGKYQVSYPNGDGNFDMVVLNTATGAIKLYYYEGYNGWREATNSNLRVNH